MNHTKNDKEYEIFCKDSFEDGIGIRVLRRFLHEMIENFAEEMFSFRNIWDEFPFIYSEKQLTSILAPVIHKYTNNIFFEQPFNKSKHKGDGQRFLDIMTKDNNNIYLIELKHAWIHNEKDKTTTKADAKWEKCIEQIEDINKETMNKVFYDIEGFFKIALMVMPTWTPEDKYEGQKTAKEYCAMLHDEYESYTSNKYKSNFIGVIKVKNPTKYTNHDILYPYVSFIVKMVPL